MGRLFTLSLLYMVFLTNTHSMIMRNNALMSKMISQFQGKEAKDGKEEPEKESDHNQGNVLSLMQNVLCRNFPSIPCELITKDATLKHLIGKSIQQLKYKKLSMDRFTTVPNHHPVTLFPVVNSEDLSNFLQVSDTGVFKMKNPRKKQQPKSFTSKNHWSHEKKTKAAVYSGRKKMRRFYPHKIKYKDKNSKRDFTKYSGEKMSMSVENLQEHDGSAKKIKHFSYRGEPADPPVWRIDYMKHGEPSFNMFGYESDSLKGKIMKTGPNVMVNENIIEHTVRKDVLHPDIYIKKNYVRKKTLDANSDGVD